MSPTRCPFWRQAFGALGAVVCLFGPAAAQTPAPARPAATQASPALIDHLMQSIERREQPRASGIFGALASPSAFAAADTFTAERQLRALGARAASAAPRLAELLLRSEHHAHELAWSLWSVSPRATAEEMPALLDSLPAAQGSERLALLARIGQAREAQALPTWRDALQAQEPPERLLAVIALGFVAARDAGDEPANLLAQALKDGDKRVRSASANGLRLLGQRARPAVPALVDYLRTRDNVYMAAQALAIATPLDLMPAQADLEAILADSKLSDFQKQPAVQLLLRIEQQRSADAAAGSPAAPAPRAVPSKPTSVGGNQSI